MHIFYVILQNAYLAKLNQMLPLSVHKSDNLVLTITGKLEVRLMGCQDLLENVPGRSKATSVPLPGWSPSETRSSFMSRGNRNRGTSVRNLSKNDDLSS